MFVVDDLLYILWVFSKPGDEKDAHVFGWNERYKVAVGVAEALEYLHNSSTKPIIHRDVKSSNILLSDDFEPQVVDFDLSVYWRRHIGLLSQYSCCFGWFSAI